MSRKPGELLVKTTLKHFLEPKYEEKRGWHQTFIQSQTPVKCDVRGQIQEVKIFIRSIYPHFSSELLVFMLAVCFTAFKLFFFDFTDY